MGQASYLETRTPVSRCPRMISLTEDRPILCRFINVSTYALGIYHILLESRTANQRDVDSCC